MRKTDSKGNPTGNKGTFIRLSLMQMDAWRALSNTSQMLFIWLRMEFKGKQFNNNGKIRLSYRQAAARLGVSTNTAMASFRDLQRKGFIVVTQKGSLGIEGAARGPCYEITNEPLPGHRTGRNLYAKWKPGAEFDVVRHNVNNPSGKRTSS